VNQALEQNSLSFYPLIIHRNHHSNTYTMDESKHSVLYVDDEDNNLISFRAAFRRNYEIFTAISAEEGINILQREQVPVIITDQRMPGMTGVEFLEKIIPEYPDTVRMILTGFSDIEAIIHAINTGRVFRYITKPWDQNEVKMSIDNAFNFYDLQQRNKTLLSQLDQKVKERERTLNLFKRYVPSAVVEQTLSAPDDLSMLSGELIEVTALFCDIRNFTEISCNLSPKEVVKFLNHFYQLMTDCVKRHNGSVNQFVGDEVFATFGAPLSYPENHINAVFAAIEMINATREFNTDFSSRIHHRIEVGIGINTGEVVAGNLGTVEQMQYSITGDTVNTAKRIETLTKDSPNTILINDSTWWKVKSIFETRPREPVMVKGKKEPLKVYEVIGRI
jgi:adenylate cyclase